MDSKIVNVNKSPYEVYIGRDSRYGNTKWGNPFIIGVDGSRNEVIEMYEYYIRHNEKLLKELPELKNKVLGCHCAPLHCHGEVLLKLLKESETSEFFT